MQTNDDAVQALCTQEQEMDMLIASKQEKIAKLSFQHQHKMAAAKETLDQLKQYVHCILIYMSLSLFSGTSVLCRIISVCYNRTDIFKLLQRRYRNSFFNIVDQ